MTGDPPFRYEQPVSWGAVLAGAVATLAISLFLTTLASGLGYAVASSGAHESGSGFTPLTGAIMVAGQCISAAFGGFIAGRLRHQWVGIHDDEAHFRDTAHGFLAWGVSALVGAGVLAAVLGSVADHAAMAAAAAAPVTPVAPPSQADVDHAAAVAAQAAFFTAVGMITSAFVAAVAGRLGGEQAEHFHRKAVVVTSTTGDRVATL